MTGIGSIGAVSTQNWELLLLKSASSSSGNAATSATGTSGNSQGVSALKEQLEEAIRSALSGIDRSAPAKTILDAVRNAVDSTLKANGIEPPKGPGGPPPGGPPPGGPGGPGGAGGAPSGAQRSGGDQDGDESTDDPLRALIDRVLEEQGFDLKRIQEEMKANAPAVAGSSTSTNGSSSANDAASIWIALLAQIQKGGVDAAA